MAIKKSSLDLNSLPASFLRVLKEEDIRRCTRVYNVEEQEEIKPFKRPAEVEISPEPLKKIHSAISACSYDVPDFASRCLEDLNEIFRGKIMPPPSPPPADIPQVDSIIEKPIENDEEEPEWPEIKNDQEYLHPLLQLAIELDKATKFSMAQMKIVEKYQVPFFRNQDKNNKKFEKRRDRGRSKNAFDISVMLAELPKEEKALIFRKYVIKRVNIGYSQRKIAYEQYIENMTNQKIEKKEIVSAT
ncbi:unnamed protein product [Blepharisma stoltei]|uniref:Uncharacterized protein n=1 Tax=Blepharisma stoltei TaxID=1481888 RepID=A0AAU9IDS5_9CILI|nr:unnamed protein product [Blepharisma stoltei]